jgi:hypothetical protein
MLNSHTGLQGKVAMAAIKCDRTLAQLSEFFDVHVNQITTWKAQLEDGAADFFGPGSGTATTLLAIDVKSLYAKVGELTLEERSPRPTYSTTRSFRSVLTSIAELE